MPHGHTDTDTLGPPAVDPRSLGPQSERHDPETQKDPATQSTQSIQSTQSTRPMVLLQACKPARCKASPPCQPGSRLLSLWPGLWSLVCSGALPDAPTAQCHAGCPESWSRSPLAALPFVGQEICPLVLMSPPVPILGLICSEMAKAHLYPSPRGVATHSLHTPYTLLAHSHSDPLSLISVSTPRRESSLSLL